MTVMVSAEGIRKSYGRLPVLNGVSLEIKTGEVCCLLGPSGAGKSTLLRCVNHLESIDGGQLVVDGEVIGYREKSGKLYEMHGRDIARQRASIGMVFQHFNLYPHMTAEQNVSLAQVAVHQQGKVEARNRSR